MLKRLFAGVVLLCVGGMAMAQTPTPTPIAPCTITVARAEDAVPDVSISFTTIRKYLTLPSETAPFKILNCASPLEEFEVFAVSPSVGPNTPAPNVVNEPGVVNNLAGYAIVNTGFANLRSGDGPGYTKVGVVGNGDELIVLGRNATRTWWYVRAGDVTGWVLGSLLILRGDLSDVPVVATAGEIIPATLFVPAARNPIYNGLQSTSVVICEAAGGLEMLIKGISFNQSWILIEAICADGRVVEGWIAADRGFIRNPAGLSIPRVRG
jgi:hypothetical protein